ncbi:hypothetical protein JGU71_14440 [Antrihabitans sp. YC3-6]|jgi:hypothetical protein|uniref:Uncharacterized protein n=1 Tax=Antrihabitans stalagmiti TaxID=2799499 RepID=A0A934NRN3_9NOCA|nr:hypothetical protein [Antrihabitans stalagmiti]MBJ8340088.1 hypothetical protein [Antrihabitans stalagmiti]
MSSTRGVRVRSFVAAVGIAAAFGLSSAGSATAAPIGFGGDCVLYTENRGATVDSLRFRCNPGQHDAIYRWATAGAPPMGVKAGWVLSPPVTAAIAPAIWIGKVFYPGFVRNRLSPFGFEGVQGSVYVAPSATDGRACWIIDYTRSELPWFIDEMREVTPGVYLGMSYRYAGTRELVFLLG